MTPQWPTGTVTATSTTSGCYRGSSGSGRASQLTLTCRGQDRPDHDLDLLADLSPDMGLFGLGRVQADLEAIIGSKVDLVPAGESGSLACGIVGRVHRDDRRPEVETGAPQVAAPT